MALPEINTPANARSRRTRAGLLAAAREILEQHGAAALTMTSVAAAAEVTRRTAYLHFGSRSALIGALFDYLADAEGLHQSLERVWSAPDAIAALDAWAKHLADYHPRLLAVDRAIEHAQRHDADAAAHRRRITDGQLRGTHQLAHWLDQDGVLAPEWSVEAAADMLFALISSDLIGALLRDRAWSQAQLATHLALLFQNTLVQTTRRSQATSRGSHKPPDVQ